MAASARDTDIPPSRPRRVWSCSETPGTGPVRAPTRIRRDRSLLAFVGPYARPPPPSTRAQPRGAEPPESAMEKQPAWAATSSSGRAGSLLETRAGALQDPAPDGHRPAALGERSGPFCVRVASHVRPLVVAGVVHHRRRPVARARSMTSSSICAVSRPVNASAAGVKAAQQHRAVRRSMSAPWPKPGGGAAPCARRRRAAAARRPRPAPRDTARAGHRAAAPASATVQGRQGRARPAWARWRAGAQRTAARPRRRQAAGRPLAWTDCANPPDPRDAARERSLPNGLRR